MQCCCGVPRGTHWLSSILWLSIAAIPKRINPAKLQVLKVTYSTTTIMLCHNAWYGYTWWDFPTLLSHAPFILPKITWEIRAEESKEFLSSLSLIHQPLLHLDKLSCQEQCRQALQGDILRGPELKNHHSQVLAILLQDRETKYSKGSFSSNINCAQNCITHTTCEATLLPSHFRPLMCFPGNNRDHSSKAVELPAGLPQVTPRDDSKAHPW